MEVQHGDLLLKPGLILGFFLDLNCILLNLMFILLLYRLLILPLIVLLSLSLLLNVSIQVMPISFVIILRQGSVRAHLFLIRLLLLLFKGLNVA